MKPLYIAIEGPIGVGKSSLAGQLAARIGADRLQDTEDLNPWLESFYRDPATNALHTQLHFLVSRIETLERLAPAHLDSDFDGAPRRGARPLVADFMIEKDPLFAELVLDEREWRLYRALHDRLVAPLRQNCLQPDLVIYLQATVEQLIQRVEKRGIDYEQRIDSAYLDGLSRLYERLFHDYADSPLLIVNTASVDFSTDSMAVDRLMDRVATLEGGRHFFDPA